MRGKERAEEAKRWKCGRKEEGKGGERVGGGDARTNESLAKEEWRNRKASGSF